MRDADELEGRVAPLFDGAMASDPADEALDRAAVERALARLAARRPAHERPPRRRIAVLAGVALAACGLAVVLVAPTRRESVPDSGPHRGGGGWVTVQNGCEVIADQGPDSVQLQESTATQITVRLRSGGASFRIRHDARRLFRVQVGSIQIEDLGTVFRVEALAERGVHVAVSEGSVAVVLPPRGSRVVLGPGEERLFSWADATASHPTASDGPPLAPAAADVAANRPHARPTDPRAALLNAADLARRSHRPEGAVAPLRRFITRYPRDPRAAAAAFSLGWVLLADLGRPREAAAAFARAELSAPSGALAEDAAARLAEAWRLAGDDRRAAAAARHYQTMYPHGRYLGLMPRRAAAP